MAIIKTLLHKKDTVQQLLDECIRWNYEVITAVDESEGEPFEAMIILRGPNTPKYLKALIEAYDAENPPDDDGWGEEWILDEASEDDIPF